MQKNERRGRQTATVYGRAGAIFCFGVGKDKGSHLAKRNDGSSLIEHRQRGLFIGLFLKELRCCF